MVFSKIYIVGLFQSETVFLIVLVNLVNNMPQTYPSDGMVGKQLINLITRYTFSKCIWDEWRVGENYWPCEAHPAEIEQCREAV